MKNRDYKNAASIIIDDLTSRKILDYDTINTGDEKHVDCFRYISKKEFTAKSKEILNEIDESTTDIQFTAIMKKIFALFKDAHTVFHGKRNANGQYTNYFNCHFKIFEDKIYVFDDNKEYLQIKTINNISIEKIKNDLIPLIPYEVETWKNFQLEKMLRNTTSYEMIQANNEKGETLNIIGIDKNGQEQTMVVNVRKPSNDEQNEQGSNSKNYDFKLLAEGKLFIDYAKCESDKNYPMGDCSDKETDGTFIGDIKSSIGDKKIIPNSVASVNVGDARITGVIIDLRKNSGGNQRIIRPLINFLSHFDLNENNVAILTGAKIFSSSVWAIADIKKTLGAKLIGEPPGQCTEAYGSNNPRMFDFTSNTVSSQPANPSGNTNSNNVFYYCMTKWFFGKTKEIAGQNPRKEIKPDIVVKQTLADYISGYDEQLQVAIKYITAP